MSIEKQLTKKVDERGNYYNGLAARVGFGTMQAVIAVFLVFYGYMAITTGNNSYLDNAILVMIPGVAGGIVYSLLLIKWRIGDRK